MNGLTPWYKTTPKIQPDEFPVNYPVPDFGMEENIIETKKSIALEEKKLKHTMKTDWFKTFVPPPRNYFVPDFGVDSDIKATQKSIKGAEKYTGSKLHADFDKNTRDYPINYSVPSFGADPEIVASQ